MDIILNIIFFISLVIGILYLIHIPVLKGKLCKPLRPWYILISTPKDFYGTLANTLIIPDELDRVYNLEFFAKYIGLYGIGFITEKRLPSNYDPSDFALSLRIRFIFDHKTILGPITANIQSSWWGKEETGFILHTFRAPEDVPLDKNIQCEVQVMSPSYGYSTRGEEITVCVKKLNEK